MKEAPFFGIDRTQNPVRLTRVKWPWYARLASRVANVLEWWSDRLNAWACTKTRRHPASRLSLETLSNELKKAYTPEALDTLAKSNRPLLK